MNRVCFITGGTRGIGFAVAQALLAQGGRVAITGTSADGAARAATKLLSEGHAADSVLALQCDVRDAASVEAAMEKTSGRMGGIDVLVNNAGVGVGDAIAKLAPEEWHRIIDTNLTGVFHCCRAVIPHLRQRGGGWIISVSSLSSKSPFPNGAAYCAAKAGVNAFSDALMQELRDDKIRVSCVLPGSVDTGFSGRSASAGTDWKLRPEDVAQTIVGLLAYPERSLPSRVEIRPSRPPKS